MAYGTDAIFSMNILLSNRIGQVFQWSTIFR